MKFECVKDKLKRAVALTEHVTGKNTSLPILESICITADKGRVSLRATNLDIGLEIVVPANVSETGSVAVPGSILNNFLSSVSRGDVITATSVNENLHVETEGSTTLVKSFPTDDFPSIPRVSGDEKTEVEAERLVNGLRSVSYAASLSDLKPEIAGVAISVDGDKLVFRATDSFRFAERRVERVGEVLELSQVIIPHKNVYEILRVFEGAPGLVRITVSKNQIAFETDDIYVTSRLIDGAFPDVAQIVPKKYATEATLLKQEFAEGLKLTSVFSGKLNQVGIKVLPKERLFELHAKSQDVGENSTQIAAALEGDDVELNFNARYISDCLASIPQDSIRLAMNGSGKPMVISGIGDASFLYLVMPMAA